MKSREQRWVHWGWPPSVYLLVTLVIPYLGGAGARDDFSHHASFVLAGTAATVLAWHALFSRKAP